MGEPSQVAKGDRVWRGAALILLAGGIGGALWHDPALLDRREVAVPLAAGFAALWMVPHLRARLGRRPAETTDAPIRHIADPGADRAALDLTLGGVAGLLAGALFLSFPGSAALLTRGPQAVDWAFDRMQAAGMVALIAVAMAALVLGRLLVLAVMAAVRVSRFLAAFVIGLYLWLPFHATFQAGLARLGVELPGLETPYSGANT